MGLLPSSESTWYGTSNNGFCAAESSSCSGDSYDPWADRPVEVEETDEEADGSDDVGDDDSDGEQQEAEEAEPPPPVNENDESEDSPDSPTTSEDAQQDTPGQAELRDYLMRSPVGHLIAEIIFGKDKNGKDVAEEIIFANPEEAIKILRDADDQFVNAHLGRIHNKTVGENFDFRSFTRGKNRLGKKSLQINIGKKSGEARADLDRSNPGQDVVGFVVHAFDVFKNIF